MSRGNALTACYRSIGRVIPGHLYTFEVEVETDELTSTELVFEFEIQFDYSLVERPEEWEVQECGMLQLLEKHLENNSEKFPELVREDDGDNRQLLFFLFFPNKSIFLCF
ncbi:BnaA08g14770D [Brassica napus]|nr:BnaA08g14770D [Brassica napus]